jgi:hypothetical protein
MSKVFYTSQAYKEKQSLITKRNWQNGDFDFLKKQTKKYCANSHCNNVFYTIPSDPKKFCSNSCAAQVSNRNRILSELTKKKISLALEGKPSLYKGIIKVQRIESICQNPKCNRQIIFERWRSRKFCSNACAMKVIGGKPTSPRAARGKSGIREDLGKIYFYSRWEANFARLLNFLNVKWQFQPETFDLGTQKYTPDFYLPDHDMFVEIKNFLSEFSYQRDKKFRSAYPRLKLLLLLKPEYLKLQEIFSPKIKNWEYS